MRKLFFLVVLVLVACEPNVITREEGEGYSLIRQTKGPVLGYTSAPIIEMDGYAFKDLSRDGVLDPYEDWRLPVRERAADLASRLTLEEICGLMLYSRAVDIDSAGLSLTHQSLIADDHIRHMLVRNVTSPAVGASWSNAVQAFCESSRLGIPSNNSSDPRNYTNAAANYNFKPELDGEYDPTGENDISKWPREMGLAATFDMDVIRAHGEIVSAEYRALGITTALSPQADMASDPRWRRFYGTFSEDPYLCRDIAQTYCDAFQTTPGSKTGWGAQSVNCMVKHWPGGGTGEGGRDAHFGIGKYAVYPGNNFAQGLIPFTEGAFALPGKTQMASAVMPYYTISYGQDPSGENVANGFSKYIIQNLLRDEYHYEGVVCSDWGIVRDYEVPWKHDGKPWGTEYLSEPERRLLCFEAGVDQLGGAKDNAQSVAAYELWAQKYGEDSARERFELSARRILVNIFNVGLFENPYIDPQEAVSIVGCKEFVAAGYDAQLKSIVMLKNAGDVLPITPVAGQASHLKVYQPFRHLSSGISFWRKPTPSSVEHPISDELLSKYFDIVDNPDEADFALVSIKTPVGHWGYIDPEKGEAEGHYNPISLQWNPYTAATAREQSIAGGDPHEASANRSYRGYTETSSNESDAILVRETKAAMGSKPVILVIAAERPFVPAKVEPWADAILMTCGVSNNAVLDIVSGAFEPYGLLPCQLPANMETVEAQCEDVPHDMRCYVDACGNRYDFAFGLNWGGVIRDERVEKYAVAVRGEIRADRKDDLIWENEYSGYRAFGPALQAGGEKAYGYDIFTKSVTYPVLHERYEKALGPEKIFFHTDHGDGMDAFGVGPTLGCGTAALVDSTGIVYPWCWQKARIIENGPKRFMVELTYAPVIVDGCEVIEHRLITLESGNRLNRVDISYDGLDKPYPIVVGIVVHRGNPSGYYAGKNTIATADLGDRNIGQNGEMYCGALLPGGFDRSCLELFDQPKGAAIGHVLGYSTYYPGRTFTYYFGSGWSKAGIRDLNEWIKLIEND